MFLDLVERHLRSVSGKVIDSVTTSFFAGILVFSSFFFFFFEVSDLVVS